MRIFYSFSGFLTTLAVTLALAGSGAAQELDTIALEEVFFELVTKDAPWPSQNLEVSAFTAEPERLVLPEGALTFEPLNQPHPLYFGKKKLKVEVLVDGEKMARVTLQGRLHLYGEVTIANRRLARHTVLSDGDLRTVRRDLSQLGSDIVNNPVEVVGQRLRNSVTAGAILFSHMLEEPPLVQRGDLVNIQAQSDFITVTVPGEVRSSGARGDAVRVKNLMSRREIYAEVLDAETVQVQF